MFQRYVTFKYFKLCVISYPVVVIILVSGNKETKNPTVCGGGGGEGGRGEREGPDNLRPLSLDLSL